MSKFYFSLHFLILIDVFTKYISSMDEECDRDGGDAENGPKRRVWPVVSNFIYLLRFFDAN